MSGTSNCSPPDRRRRGLARRDESGAALVEFALVFGLFVMVIYGLIAFGMVLATKQRITNAAAEAARSTVGVATAAAAQTTATDRVTKILGDSNGRYTVTAAPSVPACAVAPAECITVSITWNYKDHPVVPPAPGLGLVMPKSFGSTATVQFK